MAPFSTAGEKAEAWRDTRSMVRVLIMAALLVSSAGCDRAQVGPQVGGVAPVFQAAALAGGQVRFADHTGKPIMLVFCVVVRALSNRGTAG